jgi:H+-translocating NAD(P) transhydrogenase subunit beta
MDAQTLQTIIHFSYVFAAALFVVGLHQMNSPVSARQGNLVSAAGMAIAVIVTAIQLLVLGSPARVRRRRWPGRSSSAACSSAAGSVCTARGR